MSRSQVLLQIFAILALSCGLTSIPTQAHPRYRKSEISDARFGTGERAALLKSAYHIAEKLNQKIVGQEAATASLQQRLIQYLEGFPHRTREPIALNMIGLPGVGKSAMIDVLRESGFKVIQIDAQKYANDSSSASTDIANAIAPFVVNKQPLILAIEELDKIKELKDSINGEERTSPLIGALNEILSDGQVSLHSEKVRASNIFVLTTMNFAPDEITEFTSEVLKANKSFYDLTVEDLVQFIEWVKASPGARYKILSKFFRSNTVGRIAPNMVIMEPIIRKSYRKIVELKVKEAITKATEGENANKRLQVSYDPSLLDFLESVAIYAPSGARETIFLTNTLTEQLINIGGKAQGAEKNQQDIPREIHLSYDKKSKSAQIIITPFLLHGRSLEPATSFEVSVVYDESTRMFLSPPNLASKKPHYPQSKSIKDKKRITKKLIKEVRFPKSLDLANGLDEAINARLTGQQQIAKIIKDDMNRFLSRSGPAQKEPSYRIFSGFPGIGKSELVKIVAEYLEIPLIRMNMQQFSSDSAETVWGFFESVADQLRRHRVGPQFEDKPYILLLEELDKVYEIDPEKKVVNRPIMGVIKDLLSEGRANYTSQRNGEVFIINIRNAFTFGTMNFSVDRFGFEADPRLTSVEDVMKAWKDISSTPMTIKSLLGSMFLPETVSRMMSRFSIVKPLSRLEYIELVKKQIEQAVSQRLLDDEGRNIAQIKIEASPKYLQYLFNETVIPSEGARNTVVSSANLISTDLEDVLMKLPKSSKYVDSPLVITLHYIPSKMTVVGKVRLEGEATDQAKKILEKSVGLNFPPMRANGKMSEFRLLVSAHEFGHALSNVRLGLRINDVVVVSPQPGVGGYVTMAGERFTALEMMGRIYSLLAARAMERIVLNEDPLSENSVLHITTGASSDIVKATKHLYEMTHLLGLDPNGGTIDSNYVDGVGRYAHIAPLSAEMAKKLSYILRDMEEHIIKDFLSAHDKDWYAQKIVQLSRKGAMSEEEFYELIGYKYPGDKKINYGTNTQLRKLFQKYILALPGQKVQKSRRGKTNETVIETADNYLKWFAEALRKHLHDESGNAPSSCSEFLE